MKKFKTMYVIWGLLVLIIVGLLTYLGFVYQNKLKPYKDLERELVNTVSKYIEKEFLYPNNGETLKVSLTDLKSKGLISELIYGDDTCDGYVIVTFNNVYNYDAFIKCNNYETKGY